MNVKELILNQDFEKMIEVFKEFYVPEYEDKEEKEKHFRIGFQKTLKDIEETIPEETKEHHLIYGIKYKDYNSDGTFENLVDHCSITIKELKNLNENVKIETFDDFEKCNFPNHWSLMFVAWEEILGYEVIKNEFVNDVELACEILWELTFFGYSKESNEENSKEEMEELDRREKEIKEAIETGDNSKFVTIDDDFFDKLREELGEYDGMTEEEKLEHKKQEKIDFDIMMEKNREEILKKNKLEYELLKKLKKEYT